MFRRRLSLFAYFAISPLPLFISTLIDYFACYATATADTLTHVAAITLRFMLPSDLPALDSFDCCSCFHFR